MDWKHELDLRLARAKYEGGEIELVDFVRELVQRGEQLKDKLVDPEDRAEEFQEILGRFADLLEDLVSFGSVTDEDFDQAIEQFDRVLEDLYDWGDVTLDGRWPGRKLCWVAMF